MHPVLCWHGGTGERRQAEEIEARTRQLGRLGEAEEPGSAEDQGGQTEAEGFVDARGVVT